MIGEQYSRAAGAIGVVAKVTEAPERESVRDPTPTSCGSDSLTMTHAPERNW